MEARQITGPFPYFLLCRGKRDHHHFASVAFDGGWFLSACSCCKKDDDKVARMSGKTVHHDVPHRAMITACARLLRGSGYLAFDGEVPADPVHAALASEYAHVTAPLRRLGDRYAGEICVALCAGTEVPAWVAARLSELPDVMKDAGRRAAQYEAMVLDLVEAGVLHGRVGEMFEAVVTDVDAKDSTRGRVVIQEPAVEARVTARGPLPLGTEAEVRLTQADVGSRAVAFEVV